MDNAGFRVEHDLKVAWAVLIDDKQPFIFHSVFYVKEIYFNNRLFAKIYYNTQNGDKPMKRYHCKGLMLMRGNTVVQSIDDTKSFLKAMSERNDFDEFGGYPTAKDIKKLKKLIKQMPKIPSLNPNDYLYSVKDYNCFNLEYDEFIARASNNKIMYENPYITPKANINDTKYYFGDFINFV